LTFSSKSQYERRFRAWNLRKNLKRKDWQGVIEYVHKRAKIGKESEVRFNRAVLTYEKVVREALRYGWTRDCQIEASEGIDATLHDLVVYLSSLDVNSYLPKDVIVCTPPSVGAEDEMSQTLHQVSRDATPNQGYCHERPDRSIQMAGLGTGLWRVTTYGFQPLREQFQPFAWFSTLDWKSIPDGMIQSLKPVGNHTRTSTQITAMFCAGEDDRSAPKNQYNQPVFDGSTTSIQYSMASILNKLRSSGVDPFYWLRGIPWPIAARIFGGMPGPIKDVFRERMFAEAINDDNKILAKAMLELGINPLEKININGHVETPPVYATKYRKFSVLRVLILHMIKTDAKKELEYLLPVVISVTKDKVFQGPVLGVCGEGIELIRLILSSGAKATLESFMAATEHYTLWNELMEVQEDGIYGWLQNGLFLGCIKSVFGGSDHFAFCDWVLREILRTDAGKDFVIDDKIEAALSDAFKFFVNAGLVDRAQALFETCVTIKVRLLYPTSEGSSGNGTIAQACRSMDLDILRKWIDGSSSDHLRCSSPSTISRELEQAIFHNRHHPEATSESIYQAVLNDDLFYVESELDRSVNQKHIHGRWELVLRQTAQLGRDKIAIAILQHPVLPANLIRDGVSVLLEHGRISPLSEFVCAYPQVRQALVSATTESNYDRLDDLLRQSVSFSKPLEPPNLFGNFGSRSQIDRNPATLLGALACCAIHHDDSKLLEWLLGFGLETHCHFSTVHVQGDSGLHHLPPLLGIAAAHGKTQVVRYLLEREGKDNLPLALSWVIQSQASEEFTSILLNEFKSPKTNKVARCYSKPLHHAIRNRDYKLVRLLARSADMNYIVREIHQDLWVDNSHGDSSPLGEAVRTQDFKATTIMLENGGDPNMLAVLWRESRFVPGKTSSDGAFLARSTSIIAAIDTKSLPMVQLLVQSHSNTHGLLRSGLLADINHPPRLGLLRTPLQRAAETGCFDIVRYLVEQGAEIDLAPCYGGGTALQLAALQGHVGIATFLLERGADPNFPPARGPGRTAFEAAAEWNRIDMLSLLMKWGCRLEMDIANDPDERPHNHPDIPYYYYPDKRYGEDSDGEVETDHHQSPTSTQYERAMRFAKSSGHMACKRFIEHLYQQCAESTSEGYWDPEGFTNAEQDLNGDADFWRQFGLDI
jgi:ankyrin repeat protein